MNPADAVDAQREIAEFHRSRAGRDYLVAYFHNTRDTRAAERRELARTSPALALGMELMSRDDLEHKLDETIEEMADATSEVIDLSLRIAETFAVSEEMFDVVRTGAASIPPTMVERPDLPAERGFLLLPRPLLVSDVHGKQIGVRALVWGVTGGQVEVIAFSDMRDVDDYTAVRPQVPGVRWLVTTSWKVSLDRTIENSDDGYAWAAPQLLALRFLVTFWLLCRQQFASLEPAHPERAARRRFARLFGFEPTVRVIVLRRRSGSGSGFGETVWHHRWIVRGHWRKQPCGPGRSQVRAIYIAPFVKGPDDAPFIGGDIVNYLAR